MKVKTWTYEATFKDADGDAFGTVSAVTQDEATMRAYRAVRQQYPYLAIYTMRVKILEKGKRSEIS